MKQELQIQYLKAEFFAFRTTIWVKGQRCYLLLLWRKSFTYDLVIAQKYKENL